MNLLVQILLLFCACENCMHARGKRYPGNVRISRIDSAAPLSS